MTKYCDTRHNEELGHHSISRYEPCWLIMNVVQVIHLLNGCSLASVFSDWFNIVSLPIDTDVYYYVNGHFIFNLSKWYFIRIIFIVGYHVSVEYQMYLLLRTLAISHICATNHPVHFTQQKHVFLLFKMSLMSEFQAGFWSWVDDWFFYLHSHLYSSEKHLYVRM